MKSVDRMKLARVIPIRKAKNSTRRLSSIIPYGHWAGGRCLIIGGGPSLSGFNFKSISGEFTIGINKAFISFNPTVNYSMDYRLYEKLTSTNPKYAELVGKFREYGGVKVFLDDTMQYRGDVFAVPKLKNKAISYDLDAGIYGGSNSGFGAIMLAIALGFTKIGLLGYDFKVDEQEGKTHWHDGYDQNLESMKRILDGFRCVFEEFAHGIFMQGIDVSNLNPDSGLRCFRFETLNEFLRDPTSKSTPQVLPHIDAPRNAGLINQGRVVKSTKRAKLSRFEAVDISRMNLSNPDIQIPEATGDTPLMSVVTPCYNFSGYLHECIRSFLAQRMANVEMVVVDDGSKDDIKSVVDRYAEAGRAARKFVRYVWKEHSGISATRNTAILAARSNIVVPLDSDDILMPDGLLLRYHKMRDGYKFVHGPCYNLRDGRLFIPYNWKAWKETGSAQYIHAQGVAIHKDIFRRIGLYDENFWAKEDRELYFRILDAGYEVGEVTQEVAVYRVHEGSMTRSTRKKQQDWQLVQMLDEVRMRRTAGNYTDLRMHP